MGKKTDAFTQSLIAAGNAADDLIAQLTEASRDYYASLNEWRKEEAKKDYSSQAFQKCDNEVDDNMQKGRVLRMKFRTALNSMEDVINDFEKYIVKKEKSKNPFRGKKSVPAAKLTIKNYKQSLVAGENLLKSISDTFPT